MNSRQTTSHTVSMLTGASLGALAVYLFDSRLGAERRERIKQTASGMAKGAQEAFSSTWGATREKAEQLGQAASAGSTSVGSGLKEAGQGIYERIGQWSKGAGKELARRRGGLWEYVGGGKMSKRAGLMSGMTGGRLGKLFGKQPKPKGIQSTTGQTLLALGCIALGMGIMYVLDPTAGRRRRAFARDKVRSSINEMGTNMQKKGRDVWHRTTGLVSELRHRTGRQMASDSTLVERIRAEMGHVVSDAASIHVSANNRRITLSGPIEAAEVDPLLKCVWSVPGVVELINRLDIRQPAAVSDLPGEQTRTGGGGVREIRSPKK
ncbi:MAG TPA: BON domain-containing protein [Tepidisphaeraceae bacterium]|nr:BON domain-containing protein [Tepidisphaeraceae bacterium]